MAEPIANVASRIMGHMISKGQPLTLEAIIAEFPDVERKTVHNRILDLVKTGKLAHDQESGTYITGESFKPDIVEGNPAAKKPKEDATLDPRERFMALVRSTGVKEQIIPTIADFFFAGDINKISSLDDVLGKQAVGFVTRQQHRMIRGTWAKIMNLDYDPGEFDTNTTDDAEGKDTKGGKKEKPSNPMDLGMGWQVKKDKDGEWVPVQGGDLNYEQALLHCERMNMARGYAAAETGDDAVEEPGKPRAGKTKQSPMDTLLQTLLTKMVEQMTNPKKEGDSEELKVLRLRIQQLEDDKAQRWREGIESTLAALVSRDPVKEIMDRKKELGLEGTPTVTSPSPAVQVITDQSNKLEKQGDRLLGILERRLLKDDYVPEETRTPTEREKKAGELLNSANSNEHSKQLRKELFDV